MHSPYHDATCRPAACARTRNCMAQTQNEQPNRKYHQAIVGKSSRSECTCRDGFAGAGRSRQQKNDLSVSMHQSRTHASHHTLGALPRLTGPGDRVLSAAMLICNHARISVTFFGCVATSAWTQDRVSACTVIGSRYGPQQTGVLGANLSIHS